ncbi:MAG TPA: hypothetical protein PKU91_10435, partial [Phycisphaerales bacterium]|nr:hypothetical protein [Phycisphaerales bacterium]
MIPTDDTTPRPSRPPAIPAAGTVATGLDHNPGRVPDPGSGRARAVALVVLVVFFGVTFILQQLASSGPERPSNESAVITPPGNDPDVWVAKLAVKFSNLGMFKDQGSPAPGAAMMPQIDAAARTPIDRFRAAIIAAEVIGAEEGLARLDRLAESLGQGPLASIESPTEPGPDQAEVDTPLPPTLAADMATLEAVYRGTADSLTVEQQDGLVARHGWFGRLALTHGLDNADPRRDPLVSGGGTLLAVSIVLGAGFFLLLVAGLVLCIVVIVRIISGKMTRRFTPPAIGGSVYLETAAVFVVAFVVFKVMLGLLGSAIGTATGPMGAVVLSAQWVLLLAAL